MFFVLSKLLGWLIKPLTLAVMLGVLALALHRLRRLPRLRRILVWVALIQLWVLGCGATASLLLWPLESWYPRPDQLPQQPAAIIMLSGQLHDTKRTPSRYEMSEASDRFVETLRLAQRYPRARVVFSGGSARLMFKRESEAKVLGWLSQQLGLAKERLLVDATSRNTWENAVNTARLLREHKVRGPLVLVTSAYHMPRSVGCFAKQALQPVPWPVDFQRQDFGPGAFIPSVSGIQRSTMALHEYLGLVMYWLAGYR